MKRTACAMIILVIILLVGSLEQIFITKTLNNMISDAEQLALTIQLKDYKKAEAEVEDLEQHWLHSRNYFASISPNSECKDLTPYIVDIKAQLITKDYSNAYSQTNVLVSVCIHKKELLTFGINTII
ncbi:MAG: DUF4363 family protein [Clostridia bacterium]